MIDWLIQNLQTNEFMQATIVAAPLTALTYTARNLPVKIWDTVSHWFSYEVSFKSDQEEYYYVNKLVSDQIVNQKWSREFAYDHISFYNDNTHENEDVFLGMNIGYGRHWGWYDGHLAIVYRNLEEDTHSERFKERLTIYFMGQSREPVERFCAEVSRQMRERQQSDTISLRRSHYNSWENHGQLSPRPLSSVFTNDNLKHRLVTHLEQFVDSREACIAKGLPWRTGVLLTGPPGTGKTSLIHAMASATNRDINFLNLSGVESDRELASLIGAKVDWSKTILVIEDIDAAKANVDRDSDSEGISLSSLLNILDGFLTPEGMVTIATTNHPDRLDPALIRSGRFDFVAELGPLEWAEAETMADLLLGKDNLFGTMKDDYSPMVGAEVQKLIMSDFSS